MIPTSSYPYFEAEYNYFNPVQESCYPYFTEDSNLVVSSTMASGKTLIAECIFGYELSKENTVVCYVSPLKALTNEKCEAWKNVEEFSKHNIALLRLF